MSSDPVGTKPFIPTKYYNSEITSKDFCVYDGKCPVALNTYVGQIKPCFACLYKKEISVPMLLEERNKSD